MTINTPIKFLTFKPYIMKKLLLFTSFLCFCTSLFAQDTPDDFANRVRSIFQHVDANQTSTGILMDCGAELST